MPRQKHTAELAAEPRPWQRMCRERANRTMSCTVRKYGSYSSSAISASSCSIACRVGAGTPSGQRWLAPSSVRRRSQRGRRVAFRHDLARILVAQLVERERAARGDLHRSGEQLGRMQLREALDRAQVTLAVRKQREPRPLDGGADAGCGEHVLQRAAAARRACARRPAATSGSSSSRPRSCNCSSRLRSRPVVSSSTAIQSWPGKSVASQRACGSVGLRGGQPQAQERG